jgi:serine/threonine protein kinase
MSLGSSTPTGIGTESLLEATITRALRHPNVVFTKSVQLDPEHPTRVVTVCELGRQTLQEYLDLDPNRDDPDVSRAAIPASTPSAATTATTVVKNKKDIVTTLDAAVDAKRKHGSYVFRAVPLSSVMLMSYLSLINDMTSGLKYVHSHNIAHFDLKPENILLFDASQTSTSTSTSPFSVTSSTAVKEEDEEEEDAEDEEEKTTTAWCVWTAKLADFGLAEKITELEPDQQIGGTLHYRAPEILCPETHTRKHAFAKDWWSLLVMAWSMLFGCHPFASRAEFERMEHERDMLRCIFRKLGWPRTRWLETYVDADARSHLSPHVITTTAPHRKSTTPRSATTPTPTTTTAVSGVDVIVRLLKQRTGLSYGRWCESYGEPVMGALMRMFARGFAYDPAKRVFDFRPVWHAARVVWHAARVYHGESKPFCGKTLALHGHDDVADQSPDAPVLRPTSVTETPSSSRLPLRSSLHYRTSLRRNTASVPVHRPITAPRLDPVVETGNHHGGGLGDGDSDSDERRADWFKFARKHLPAPIAYDVWEIWCLLLDLKCARVAPDDDEEKGVDGVEEDESPAGSATDTEEDEERHEEAGTSHEEAGTSHEEAGTSQARPQALEYDAIVSLSTKLAGFKHDLRYVNGGGTLGKTYLRALYARQNQIIDRLGFRFSRSSPPSHPDPHHLSPVTPVTRTSIHTQDQPIVQRYATSADVTAATARLKRLSLRRSLKALP